MHQSGSAVTSPQSQQMPSAAPELDHRSLLLNLKKSVELWFLARRDGTDEATDSADTYLHMQSAIISILSDGLKLVEFEKLTNDFNWLQTSLLLRDPTESKIATCNNRDDFLSSWILQGLRSNSLCGSLQLLVSDKELIENYYARQSFIRDEKYATALFICISAVELNQSSLLSQIDGTLYHLQATGTKHKRSSSHPHFSISPKKPTGATSVVDGKKFEQQSPRRSPKRLQFQTFRLWKSLPNLKQEPPVNRPRSKTFSQPINIPRDSSKISKMKRTPNRNVPEFTYQHQPTPSAPSTSKTPVPTHDLVPVQLVKTDDIKIWFDRTQDTGHTSSTPGTLSDSGDTQSKGISPINSFFANFFASSPNKQSGNSWSFQNNFTGGTPSLPGTVPNDSMFNFLPVEGEKIRKRNPTNIFDANTKISESDQLVRGSGAQSLTSFLQTARLSRNNTELEKENAHFKISEAIISAIEHIKCAKAEREISPEAPERRRPRNLKTSKMITIKNGRTSSQHSSGSSLVDEIENPTGSASEDECELFLPRLIDADNGIAQPEDEESANEALSAESVGLSLISKFSDKHLPKVSDLKWLVSEEDAPQKLLPMPDKSSSRDPDENVVQSLTRGTRYWAPPRQQIIFTDHPIPNRKELIQKQNYRCAGCGMRVSPVYISRFRYCTYLGKFHCTGCHRNQISAIPAKVLAFWDFKCYPVSVFAYRLLEQIWTYPLFYVPDLNAPLYTRVKLLYSARLLRVQLKFVKDFIDSCRFAEREQNFLSSLSGYMTSELDTWSMADFASVQSKTIHKTLQDLIANCEKHVFDCVLCTARGFICELCRRDQVIYPWQTKTQRCDKCGTCFHQNCWRRQSDNCIKCQRLTKRRHQHDDDEKRGM